jgi:hypothetical protein
MCATLDAACPALDQAACVCAGCTQAMCDDMNGNYADCVCPQCAADPFCSDAGNCATDGMCDPFNEGCVCPDCADHPACP